MLMPAFDVADSLVFFGMFYPDYRVLLIKQFNRAKLVVIARDAHMVQRQAFVTNIAPKTRVTKNQTRLDHLR